MIVPSVNPIWIQATLASLSVDFVLHIEPHFSVFSLKPSNLPIPLSDGELVSDINRTVP